MNQAEVKENTDVINTRVFRNLTFKLTEKDYAEKGTEAAQVAHELGKVNREFESIKISFKGKIADKERELNKILTTVHEGEEERHVECIERRDYNAGLVSWLFNNVVMEERAMTSQERQIEMKPILVEAPATQNTQTTEVTQ